MRVLLLRFDAPLMSFGGVAVDSLGVTDPLPGRSMLTGLFANALGYDRREVEKHQALQARIRHAVRRDRRGTLLIDYQTADLGQDFMLAGWTTAGAPESRGGGSASKGTHIRKRHYWADAIYTAAVSLTEGEGPDLDVLSRSLQEPERPLFLGRKCCPPAAPIGLGVIEAESLYGALLLAPPARGEAEIAEGLTEDALAAWWPEGEGPEGAESIRVEMHDERDWANQVHVGRRHMRAGSIRPSSRSSAGEAHDG